MLLSELVELVKMEAGQHEVDLQELEVSKYKMLLERRVLPVTNRHIPYTQDVYVEITGSPHSFITTDIPGIPKWISSVMPVGNISSANVILSNTLMHTSLLGLTDITKPTFFWKYVKPTLYVQYIGEMLIQGCYDTYLEETDDEDYTIELLNSSAEEHVITLLSGYAMITLGRSRRSAKVIDLPVEFDTDALIAEGQEIVREAMISIQADNDFFLAIGGGS